MPRRGKRDIEPLPPKIIFSFWRLGQRERLWSGAKRPLAPSKRFQTADFRALQGNLAPIQLPRASWTGSCTTGDLSLGRSDAALKTSGLTSPRKPFSTYFGQQWVCDCVDRRRSRVHDRLRMVFPSIHRVGIPNVILEAQYPATEASVYASTATSRPHPQDSRPGGRATALLQDSCIPYCMPV
jgi:hypothetical protein